MVDKLQKEGITRLRKHNFAEHTSLIDYMGLSSSSVTADNLVSIAAAWRKELDKNLKDDLAVGYA